MVLEEVVDAQNAAWCRRSTSYVSSCSHDGVAAYSTAHRIVAGAIDRNSSSRATLRRHLGGSCTRVGPSASPRRSARSRCFGSHDPGS